MTMAKTYWNQIFKDYQIEQTLTLPVDRKLPSNDVYTGHGFTVDLHFDSHIVKTLVNYASHFNVTLYQICLTIYYVFLFKLTGGQQDLVVGTLQANRYRPELRRLIGMFVNTIPMRIRVDLQDTFEQLLSKVSNMMFEAQPHVNLPYQCIIEQLSMKRRHERSLIQTMFTLDEYQTVPVSLGDATIIGPCSINDLNDHSMQIGVPRSTAAMFSMTLSMEHVIQTQTLRAELTASSDIFDSDTVMNMAQRFQLIVEQLISPISMATTATEQSICDLSLILPEEIAENTIHSQPDSLTKANVIGKEFLATLVLHGSSLL